MEKTKSMKEAFNKAWKDYNKFVPYKPGYGYKVKIPYSKPMGGNNNYNNNYNNGPKKMKHFYDPTRSQKYNDFMEFRK